MKLPIINPDHPLKQLWNVLIILCTIFFALEIPVRIVLNYALPGWLLALDLLVTALFIVDIALNFLTGELNIKGQLITDRGINARRYLKSWFIIDVLSAIPFDLLFAGVADFTRILRLVRLFRLARLAQFMQKMAHANVINIAYLRMFFLVFWVLMVAHWTACGWIAFGGGNIPEAELTDKTRLFIRSLYWALTTMVTIGYGDITPVTNVQTIYTMLIQLMGAGMYGYVIGNIASLLANIDVARSQYLEKVERVNAFMRLRKIPSEMQEGVRNYYSYLWETRRGYDEAMVLGDLPRPIVEKVSMFLLKEIIEKVPIFQGASQDCIRQIVVNLRPGIYPPGDYIFRKGDIGHSMYFISQGAVEVVSDDGRTVYATLREGNFFGEIALLMSMPRTASIRAVDYCDVYTLDKDTFTRILGNYPAFSEQVMRLARQRQAEIIGDQSRDLPDGESKPAPGKTNGLSGRRRNDQIELTWHAVDNAAIYQIIRFVPETGRWKVQKNFQQACQIQIPAPVDGLPARYRVRAANQSGTGEWSDAVEL